MQTSGDTAGSGNDLVHRLARERRSTYSVKHIFDAALAVLAIFLLIPFLLLVALAIRLDSEGPVIFKQTRTGLRGRPFQIYKFRTMSVLENGPVVQQVTTGDKRVTRIGRWLRRTSIDELPQLLNVIRGEMSLVGPRPHAQAHDQYYAQRIRQYSGRFAVRPGITGWAQVNGSRGETPTLADMQHRIDLDLWYVKNWSHALDLKILVQTLVIEIARRGCGR
nr:exopolysaccharide biosynthesis polyprenyl glycosylphosphotransferase [Microvirga makkahensis]